MTDGRSDSLDGDWFCIGRDRDVAVPDLVSVIG